LRIRDPHGHEQILEGHRPPAGLRTRRSGQRPDDRGNAGAVKSET
jgi:hypothetical protein